jgi:hypothetical protein
MEPDMAQTSAERQRIWRKRHRGEPRGNAAMTADLAALQGRVAQLEVELAGRPQQPARKVPGRQPAADTALQREQDELAERLASKRRSPAYASSGRTAFPNCASSATASLKRRRLH